MILGDPQAACCPLPRGEQEVVLLGHGAGGRLSAELLAEVITPRLGGQEVLEDAAVVPTGSAEVVVSTDSFVVTPRCFPGGDIGSLAVHGTVNDLAMRGARPVALTLACILEEGLPLAELARITESVARAAREVGISVVSGDTKVVGRGAADGVYLNTTGVGVRLPGLRPGARGGRPGDVVLLSGPIGLHGTAVLNARADLGFEGELRSDSRPLHRLVAAMARTRAHAVHSLRDPTRGGLAAALNELAAASGVAVEIVEDDLPVPAPVAAFCELLGLDVLHVANEGCLVAFVSPEAADDLLAALRALPEGAQARVVGRVLPGPAGLVTARTTVGSARVVDLPLGEQLPRIC
ncbi:hydrogenase expression/formation protein HypE [Crossiella equi]|uniref:Hydrogenase expression/formation protein HypE n=1 Tax=Crossiella equi TaxID=130796 RepID=A0ABS5A6Y9_9PSEU|nr:hydrogenase expression/formation protein HypE [Crossiella equi]MBP2472071.1 hydrogenase expression/formation protein HypE [Crossiella equi]